MNIPQQRDVLCKVHAALSSKTNLGRKVNLTELEPGCGIVDNCRISQSNIYSCVIWLQSLYMNPSSGLLFTH